MELTIAIDNRSAVAWQPVPPAAVEVDTATGNLVYAAADSALRVCWRIVADDADATDVWAEVDGSSAYADVELTARDGGWHARVIVRDRRAPFAVDGHRCKPKRGAPIARRWLLYVENLTGDLLTLERPGDAPPGVRVRWATALAPNQAGRPSLVACGRVDGGVQLTSALAATYRRSDGSAVHVRWALDTAPTIAVDGPAARTMIVGGAAPETLRMVIGETTGATLVIEDGPPLDDPAARAERRPAIVPLYTSDSFDVSIENQLSTALTVATATSGFTASEFYWGGYATGTGASNIANNTIGAAFNVVGASSWPSGVQGYISYNVSSTAYLVIQFNSNCCGAYDSNYLYAELVPAVNDADLTGWWCAVLDFEFKTGSSFSPTVVIGSTSSIPAPAPIVRADNTLVVMVTITNNLSQNITFGSISTPLNDTYGCQPQFQYYLPAGTTALACYGTTGLPDPLGKDEYTFTYNLPDGVIMTVDLQYEAWAKLFDGEASATPQVTFQGTYADGYYVTPDPLIASATLYGPRGAYTATIALAFAVNQVKSS